MTERKVHDFTSVPPGVYLCDVTEVRHSQSRDGSDRWSLCLTVAEGEHAGRLAAWDIIRPAKAGDLSRIGCILETLGGAVEPGQLVGARVKVTIVHTEYEYESGDRGRRNEVAGDYSAP